MLRITCVGLITIAIFGIHGTTNEVQWSKWSRCSVGCGAGTQTRRRLENKVRTTVSRRCLRYRCSEGWSTWSETQCSVTCGRGYFIVRRTCRSVACRKPSTCRGSLCNKGPFLYGRRGEVQTRYNSCQAPVSCSDSSGRATCKDEVEEFMASTSSHVISTPNYPGFYLDNLNCSWKIFSHHPGGSFGDFQVEVWFSTIQIESCCDFITVRDGLNKYAKRIGSLQNSAINPYHFISTAGGIFITFTTDGSIRGLGFQVTYRLATRNSTCWRTFTAPVVRRDIIPTDVGQFEMANRTKCTWMIAALPDMRVELVVRLITAADLTEVEDGVEPTASVLTSKVGRIMTYHSRSRILVLRFPTNISYNTQGFIASYRSVSQGVRKEQAISGFTECSIIVVIPPVGHRSLSTLQYSADSGKTFHCSWQITSPPETRIFTWFSYVNIDASYDWINVYDGHLTSSALLGSFNQSQVGFRYFVSSDRYLRIEFRLVNISAGRGFNLFSEVHIPQENGSPAECPLYDGEYGGLCDITVSTAEQERKTFTSPFWPEPYGQDGGYRCEWFLKAIKDSNHVRLEVISLSIGPEDSLEIYGRGVQSIRRRMRGLTYTGQHNTTLSFTSSCHILVVRLNVNSQSSYGGFRAHYKQQFRRNSENRPRHCVWNEESCTFSKRIGESRVDT